MSRIFENEPRTVKIDGFDDEVRAFPVAEAPDLDRVTRALAVNHPFDMDYNDPSLEVLEIDEFFRIQRSAVIRAGLTSRIMSDNVWVATLLPVGEEHARKVPAYVSIGAAGFYGYIAADIIRVHHAEAESAMRDAIAEQLYDGKIYSFQSYPVNVS